MLPGVIIPFCSIAAICNLKIVQLCVRCVKGPTAPPSGHELGGSHAQRPLGIETGKNRSPAPCLCPSLRDLHLHFVEEFPCTDLQLFHMLFVSTASSPCDSLNLPFLPLFRKKKAGVRKK